MLFCIVAGAPARRFDPAGYNMYGQLGLNKTDNYVYNTYVRMTPTWLPAATITAIAVGDHHTVVVAGVRISGAHLPYMCYRLSSSLKVPRSQIIFKFQCDCVV